MVAEMQIQPVPARPLQPATMEALDNIERMIATMAPCEAPLQHAFLNGMYRRTLTMPAGFRCVSKIHKHPHFFFIMSGSVAVWHEGDGWKMFGAGSFGITLPNTRRALAVREECTWITVHRTDRETVEEVEEEIILKHDSGANKLREQLQQLAIT